MKKPGKNELWQAATFVLCIAVAWIQLDLAGSEFNGGRVTGPIFSLFEGGFLVFVLAILLTFMYRRVAAVMGIAASLICVPLYLYCTAPGLFRVIFPGNWKSPLEANLIWDMWAIAGMLTLAVAAFVCSRSFSAVRQKETPAHSHHM